MLLWWIYGVLWLCAGLALLLMDAQRNIPAVDSPAIAVA